MNSVESNIVETGDRSEAELRIHNDIQRALMKRHAAKNNLDMGDAVLDWLSKYSQEYTKMESLRPDLAARYESDPESVVSEFEKLLT